MSSLLKEIVDALIVHYFRVEHEESPAPEIFSGRCKFSVLMDPGSYNVHPMANIAGFCCITFANRTSFKLFFKFLFNFCFAYLNSFSDILLLWVLNYVCFGLIFQRSYFFPKGSLGACHLKWQLNNVVRCGPENNI